MRDIVNEFESFEIGHGNIIQANCTVTIDVKMGNFNILNGSVSLGHDVKVGSFNAFMPGVRVSGEVTIGNENFFGVYAVVLQQLTIGNRIRLGAGSVLMTKRNFCQRDLLLRLFPELRMWPLLKSHIIGIFRSGCSVFFLTEGIRKNISCHV